MKRLLGLVLLGMPLPFVRRRTKAYSKLCFPVSACIWEYTYVLQLRKFLHQIARTMTRCRCGIAACTVDVVYGALRSYDFKWFSHASSFCWQLFFWVVSSLRLSRIVAPCFQCYKLALELRSNEPGTDFLGEWGTEHNATLFCVTMVVYVVRCFELSWFEDDSFPLRGITVGQVRWRTLFLQAARSTENMYCDVSYENPNHSFVCSAPAILPAQDDHWQCDSLSDLGSIRNLCVVHLVALVDLCFIAEFNSDAKMRSPWYLTSGRPE